MAGSPVALEPVAVEDAREEVALHELRVRRAALAEASGREPVEVAHVATDCQPRGRDVISDADEPSPRRQLEGEVLRPVFIAPIYRGVKLLPAVVSSS